MTGRVSLAAAYELAEAALTASGAAGTVAASVARALVAAEADGHAGHGLSRVASYAAQVRAGKVDGQARPRAIHPRPALLAVDAAHGFAYPAFDLVTGMLPPLCRQQGVAAATIGRSHHCGVAGHHVEHLAKEGLVALLFANTPAAMAPVGGRRQLFGTNPIAFAAPLGGDVPPLVIDLSLSAVARGRIVAARQRGQSIPPGWAVDEDGQPTTDPAAALRGAMLPVGGTKGAVLALMVEILAAGLTGANFAFEASSFLDDQGPPPGTGQLVLAIDIEALGGAAVLERIALLAGAIEDEPGARLPGRSRLARRAEAAAEGLALAPALVEELQRLGGGAG